MLNIPIHLPTEGCVTEAQSQACLGQVVQQLRCRDPTHVLTLEPEGLNHGVAQGRCLVVDRLPEPLHGGLLLVPVEGVFKKSTEQPGAEQRPTEFTEWQGV